MLPILRVALAQVEQQATVERGIAQVMERTRQAAAAGAHLVVFPELSLTGYDLDRLDDNDAWFRVNDSRLDPLRELCQCAQIAAVVGVAHLTDDGRRVLASLLLHPDGTSVLAPKQHLHGRERLLFDSGDATEPVVLHGWRLGLAVCFDAAVPSHAQRLADAGTDVYVVSAFYAAAEYERMSIHMAARAMDHRMYSLVANSASRHRPVDSCGASGVWGPDGRCIARAEEPPTLLVADLDAAAVSSSRDLDRSNRD
ncbi:MAG: carbon-nitrogen hydrolase family protein [Ilumatobacteraceae bacterium]